MDISNLVAVLEKVAPATLAQMRTQYPELGKELDGSVVMGADDHLILQRAKVTVATLEELLPAAANALPRVRRRLKLSQRAELIGQFLALAGSTGVVAAVVAKSASGALVTAAVTFASSAVALFVKWRRKDVQGNEDGISKQYAELRDCSWEARLLLAQINAAVGANAGGGLESTIEKANAFAGRLYKVLEDVL
jgi:hypothetical protein